MQQRTRFETFIGLLLIAATTLLAYGRILFPGGTALYPWASDTLGHVLKAEYLRRQLAQGVWYPDLLPQWYLGLQMLRYHPPLPYYILVFLRALTGDGALAANWLIALSAFAGGSFFLLYRRWLGFPAALLGGVLFTVLPDNVRVALAEGNLPRVLATAILPLAFFFLLRLLEEDTPPAGCFLALSAAFSVIVLSHAMMAAIYAVCGTLLGAAFWAARRTSGERVALGVLAIGLGLALQGWWLLPSLTGGITEIDASAMTEAIAIIPLQQYFSPLTRLRDPEQIYVGAVLLLGGLAALLWPGARRRAAAPALVGLFGVLITTPGFNQFFNALPLHSLLWPLRFLGVASFLLLLAVLERWRGWWQRAPWPSAILALALLADGFVSARLIHLRPLHPDVLAISRQMPALPGWREATLDLSRLGSQAALAFTLPGGREQVYGWAYQGARTAANVAALNEALRSNFTAYLQDRLDLYGVDDVVLLRSLPNAPSVQAALLQSGFQPLYRGESLVWLHRDGGPRALLIRPEALGIGRGARNITYRFPRVLLGASPQLDAYTPQALRAYRLVVLSGFTWKDRSLAETVARSLAQEGIRVVVDLTGTPSDALSRLPRFLDVWGETLVMPPDQPVLASGPFGEYRLQPFHEGANLWHTHTPQGVQQVALRFDYLGQEGILLGYNEYPGRNASAPGGRVWFLGLNLPYHVVRQEDPAGLALLSRLLEIPPGEGGRYPRVPLEDYRATSQGYRFTYRLDSPGWLLFPAAFLDGLRATLDGRPLPLRSLETMVVFDAPAGTHTVEIRSGPTGIHRLGRGLSAVSALVWLGGGFFLTPWRRKRI